MNINPTDRNHCLQTIKDIEIESITKASIDHMAIPVIMGMSLDYMTQDEFVLAGGRGKKPDPLPRNLKIELYTNINNLFRPIIANTITEFVNSLLQTSYATLSDLELQTKTIYLQDRVIEPEPDWAKLPILFKDETFLFKELNKVTTLKANLVPIHDKICPIMLGIRDTQDFYKKIKVDEILEKLN
jgi:hypothetical protein